MYKYLNVIILLLFFQTSQSNAQQSLRGRFGFGLGYQSGIEFFDFSNINKSFLIENEKGLTDNLNIGGFTSYFYFLVLPNTRLNLNILSASKEVQTSQGRILSYEKNLWGIGIDYTFTIWHFNISPGFSTGKVNDFIELSSYDGASNFNQIISQFNSQNFVSSSINLENNSFYFAPQINLEYSLSRFVAVRLNYTYQIRLSEDWKFLRRYHLTYLPEKLVRNNHTLNLGLLIGFMSN